MRPIYNDMQDLHLREELDCLGGTCGFIFHSTCAHINDMIRTAKSLHKEGLYPAKKCTLPKSAPPSKEEMDIIFNKYFKK